MITPRMFPLSIRKRRVLFLDHTAALGGAELSLFDLVDAYRDTSKVLLFEEGPFKKKLREAGISVEIAVAPSALLSQRASTGLDSLAAIPGIFQMARQVLAHGRKFEIVHANSQKAFIVAAVARWMGSPPVVWHLRDILTASHFSYTNRFIVVQLANRFAARVIVNSEATGEAFVKSGGNSALVKVVYNGISAAKFTQSNSIDRNGLRESLKIPQKAQIVGCFSRLSYWKGQHVLLKAVENFPNIHVLLVGLALFGEEEYVKYLKDIVRESGLSNRVHWLGFRDDIPSLMLACDIIAHTSTEPEPFGRVIVEGQLSKRAVIATNAGGAREIISDGITGKLIPINDPNALSKAIKDLVSQPDMLIKLGANGFEAAQVRFSLERHIKNFDKAIGEI